MAELNRHSGHRKRLRGTIDKYGIKALSEVQIVEHILTMTHARRDTNELAHILLKRFGSISGILDADSKDLLMVDGIGEVTAKMLVCLPQIFEVYAQDKYSKMHPCKNIKDIRDYFEDIFKKFDREYVIVGYVSNNSFIDYQIIADGDISNVKFAPLEISKKLLKNGAKTIVIAHNHPYGNVKPSVEDIDAFLKINITMESIGIEIMDNVIIANNEFYSSRFNTLFVGKESFFLQEYENILKKV